MSDTSELIAEGSPEILRSAGRLLAELPGSLVLKEPVQGMYAMVHRDKVGDQPFFLGDVLVTSAEAEVNGELGFSCVLGDEPERARWGAFVDAGIRSRHAASEELESIIDALRTELESRRERERAMVSATTVSFDVRPNS